MKKFTIFITLLVLLFSVSCSSTSDNRAIIDPVTPDDQNNTSEVDNKNESDETIVVDVPSYGDDDIYINFDQSSERIEFIDEEKIGKTFEVQLFDKKLSGVYSFTRSNKLGSCIISVDKYDVFNEYGEKEVFGLTRSYDEERFAIGVDYHTALEQCFFTINIQPDSTSEEIVSALKEKFGTLLKLSEYDYVEVYYSGGEETVRSGRNGCFSSCRVTFYNKYFGVKVLNRETSFFVLEDGRTFLLGFCEPSPDLINGTIDVETFRSESEKMIRDQVYDCSNLHIMSEYILQGDNNDFYYRIDYSVGGNIVFVMKIIDNF